MNAKFLRVSGILFSDGSVALRPSYLSSNPRGSLNRPESPVQVLLVDDQDVVSAWGAGVVDLPSRRSERQTPPLRHISAKVPVSGNVTSFRIVVEGKTRLTTRVPETPPAFIEPLSAKPTEMGYHLSWGCRHDEEIPLYFHVRASADGGKTWYRLASRLKKDGLTVRRARLSGGAACRVEVAAYDGFNLVVSEVAIPDADPSRLELQLLCPELINVDLGSAIVLHARARIKGQRGFADRGYRYEWLANDRVIGSRHAIFWKPPVAGSIDVVVRAESENGLKDSRKLLVRVQRRDGGAHGPAPEQRDGGQS
jgi:hypothetical protein